MPPKENEHGFDNDDETIPVLSTIAIPNQHSPYGATDAMTVLTGDDADALLFPHGPNDEGPTRRMPALQIAAILSTAFTYGCIFTTLFIVTMPVECNRIQQQHPNIQKSVSLGLFIAIAGTLQLISPLVGMMSDTFVVPSSNKTVPCGKRMPYFIIGSIMMIAGILGQYVASKHSWWIWYTFAFVWHMLGLNIVYSMMIALIPDQVPPAQTGAANGILALELVTGSLFGFAIFHSFLRGSIENMYLLYAAVATVALILTVACGHGKDVRIMKKQVLVWRQQQQQQQQQQESSVYMTRLLYSLLVEPLQDLDWSKLRRSYTIDTTQHYDFFIVTISRTFYYMGLSVQAFFLYFLHDILHQQHPQGTVAFLAIVGQIAGALTCYPTGILSDQQLGGQRKPFVYLACALLGLTVFCLVFAKSVHTVLILGMVFGAANGIYLTMDTSLAVDTLPKEEECTDSGGSAQLLGVWGVAGFVGSALGPMLGGPLLYLFGHTGGGGGQHHHHHHQQHSNAVQGYSIQGYAVVFTLAASYFVLSALTLKFFLRNRKI